MLLALRSLFGVASTIITPVIRSSSVGWKSDSAFTSFTVPKPAGLAAGDLLIAIHGGDADQTLAGMAPPSGFVTGASQTPNVTSNIPAVEISSKVATSADANATNFTFSCAASGDSTAILIAVQVGTFDTTTPINFGTFTGTARTVTNLQTAPSMTGVVQGLLLAIFGTDTNNTAEAYPSGSPPSGMAFVQQVQSSLLYSMIGAYSQVLSSTAATGAKSVNTSPQPSVATNGWAAAQLVINPAVSAAPSAPVVNVGADATVSVNQTFTRLATATNSPTSYNWTIQAGPVGVGTSIGTNIQADWAPTVAGTYTLRLTATNAGGSGFDELILTVTAAATRESVPITTLGTSATATTSGTTPLTIAYQTSVAHAIGDLVFATIHVKASSVTVTPPDASWTLVGSYSSTDTAAVGVGTGPTKVLVYSTVLTAVPATTDTTVWTLNNTTATTVGIGYTRSYRAALQNGGSDLQYALDILGGYTVTGAPTNISGSFSGLAADTLRDMDRLVLHFNWNQDPGTGNVAMTATPVPTITGTTFPAMSASRGFTRTSAGDDAAAMMWEAAASAGSSTGTTLSISASMAIALNTAVVVAMRARATQLPAGGGAVVPVVNAGADATIVLGATFSRTATESNTPTSRAWTVVSGPADVGTTIGTTADLSYTPTVVGTYTLRYSGTNAAGTGTDDVILTVNPPTPVVNAGADATVTVNTAFTRTATETNSPTSRAWTIFAGPTGVGTTIGAAAALSWTPTVTGTYTLRYSATNVTGTGTDDVIVTVNPPAPVANAGADATIVLGATFSQTGSGTNTPTSYSWTVVSGPADVGSTIGSAATLSYTPTVVGTYTIRLTATNAGGSGTDDVILTVNPPAPVANAGADATVVVNTTFNRTGTATNSPTSYAWTIVSGPAGVTAGQNIGNAAALSYTPTILGTYTLRLTATNVTGSGTDDVILTVNPPAPVANAGADATIIVNNAFTRTGTATNSPTSYAWTIVSGPAGVTAGTNIGNTAALSYTPTIVGTYTLRLTATNVTGSGTDDLILTVNYDVPTVDAGLDANSDLGTAFTRTATENLQGAPVTSRAWTITSGPTGAGTTIGTAAALSWSPSQVGTYVIRYTLVTAGGTAFDEATITVVLQPPTANAGADASVLVNNAFTRTGADTGVNITSRAWTIVGGPVGVGSTIGTLAALSYTPPSAGVYTLRYTVTNAAGSAFDELILTVNGPPIVNAGVDITSANHTSISRNPVETGGGGVTSRSWTIISGPSQVPANTVLGTAALLDWTPQWPGTYTIRYSATNPYGTGTDDLIATITANTIQIASSSGAVSDVVTPNLIRHALLRLSAVSQSDSTITGSLGRVLKLASSSLGLSTSLGGTPKNVSKSAEVVQAVSTITGQLATRRTYRETVTEQATSSITGNLRSTIRVKSTSLGLSTITGSIIGVRRSPGYTGAVDSISTPTLRDVLRLVKSEQATSSITLALRRRSAIAETVYATSTLRPADLLAQYGARAATTSVATGTLIAIRRIRSTSLGDTTAVSKLSRATALPVVVPGDSIASRKLNKAFRLNEIVTGGFDFLGKLSAAYVEYSETLVSTRLYSPDMAPGIGPLAGFSRAISDVPNARLQRAARSTAREQATSSIIGNQHKILTIEAVELAVSSNPIAKLSRIRKLVGQSSQGLSSTTAKLLRISPFFRTLSVTGTVTRNLRMLTRFRVTVDGRSRIGERGGFAALTTAKAVTTSPLHRTRQVRVLNGYTTAQSNVFADIVVAHFLGRSRAKATITGNLRRRGVMRIEVTAFSTIKHDERSAGKLSTIIRIFENEELDAYVETENYTGTQVRALAAERPAVFSRIFTRPR